MIKSNSNNTKKTFTKNDKKTPQHQEQKPTTQEIIQELKKNLSYIQLQLDTTAKTINDLIQSKLLELPTKTTKNPPSANITPKPPPPKNTNLQNTKNLTKFTLTNKRIPKPKKQ